ncbi:hypothetical protein F918_03488 [Acinetobacter baumannii NIPH 601]|uniref:Uncharacterized protein n=1 Tax=Acinetobacter baumannii TaxID=470 RepID=A0A7U7Q6V7_ACIBA|nr:hypothetical protein P795_16775 [Acinetobacter baumannii ZW85-1]ENW49766.1 hypothetical protein F918_03488 [Acinetobacter baumannii NIPH 601]EXG33922.1 hypothetical protein J717_2941 [Acinetobacter baumannii 121738]KCY19500.1 hypothetical protein J635_3834 [Acinetobacter baumannii 233846]CDM70582.1 hypothetical protein ABP630_0092 [Acinetobacter baumannii P630]CRL92851.1 hypothetical protein ABCIP7010_0097 [Acinetobacter baumannii]
MLLFLLIAMILVYFAINEWGERSGTVYELKVECGRAIKK